MTEFRGWSEDFQRFFVGLQLDNSKRYFEANRKAYEQQVREPMAALLRDLEPEFGPSKLSRPNRDIRFSKDKSPYKLNIYAHGPGGYVSLDAKGLVAAGGRYEVSPPQLAKFREATAKESSGRELATIVSALEKKGYEIGGQELKRVPSPYPQDHPRARFLKHKYLIYWKNFGLQPWLGNAKARDHVAGAWRDGADLDAWFQRHVG